MGRKDNTIHFTLLWMLPHNFGFARRHHLKQQQSRFDVTLPHGRAIRPPTSLHLGRGGMGGSCRFCCATLGRPCAPRLKPGQVLRSPAQVGTPLLPGSSRDSAASQVSVFLRNARCYGIRTPKKAMTIAGTFCCITTRYNKKTDTWEIPLISST